MGQTLARVVELGLLLAAAVAVAGPGQSPDAIWETLPAMPAEQQNRPAWVRPDNGRAVRLRRAALGEVLARVGPEGGPATVITVPLPDGSFPRFRITETSVMHPELAARYPEIKTYAGRGVDDPAATIRLDWTPAGFHAQILSPRGAVYVDPYSRGDTEHYTSYHKRDYRKLADGWVCLLRDADAVGEPAPANTPSAQRSGATLRTYRLACAATGEYTAYHGGTVAAGLAAIVTAINRVTGIYETELAIRLVLVANNDVLVFTNPSADPYTNTNGSTMLGQNQTTCDNLIGSANYDIGHVFSTGGGGVAYLGSVCKSNKAGGVTGLAAPTGDAFYVDYVAHEMGHQFGANHTFNSTTSNCGGGNRNASTAYEPGSGSTIMAYAGICGADNLQSHSDPYFHSVSFDEIIAYVAGGGNCSVNTPTGNTAPTVSAGPNYTIPAQTSFELTAAGSDPDGDPLTYCWEERDLGPAQTLTAGDNGSSPLFRSFNPTNSPMRALPQLTTILANTNFPGERLPTTSRTLNFRVTARDNRAGGGGVNTADTQITVVSNAGPFRVTHPNSSVTLSGAVAVAWDVAGTTHAPINAATVNIRLSTDGGLSFPTLLASNTPNDGVELVILPNLTTTNARLRVEATHNIFFDLSNANFTILPGAPTPQIASAGATLLGESCPPGNGAIDPNETVLVGFALQNLGSGNTTNLIATLLPGGGVTAPSTPQTYGVLTAGVGAVTRVFAFTATGTCGGTITAVLQLQDGPTDYGLRTNTFTLGAVNSVIFTNSNSGSIAIPASGNKGIANPYPSTITVAGITGPVTKVAVTLVGLSHTFPDDLDILLVSPTGQKIMLMSDAGGGTALSGVTLTFDAAGTPLPDSGAISTGTYQPTDYDIPDTMTSPAPAGPYSTNLATLHGQNPNGTWSLYIEDDASKDTGSLSGGWRLHITTSVTNCCVNPDSDGDGLPDVWEAANGLNPADPSDADVDTDGDGFTNRQEYLAGTNPRDPASALRITTVTGPGQFQFPSVAGKSYEVQYRDDLVVGTWHSLTNNVAGTGGPIPISDPDATGLPQRFYRIRLLP